MSSPNDTVKDARIADTDPGSTSSDATDPGAPPEIEMDDEVDAIMKGLGGRAPVHRKRAAESAGLSGAHYDAVADPVKRHDTGEIPAPVILNVTEPLPTPPVVPGPAAAQSAIGRNEITQPAARLQPPIAREPGGQSATTIPGVRAAKRRAVFLAGVVGASILLALAAMSMIGPSRPSIPASARPSSTGGSPPTSMPPETSSAPRTIAPPSVNTAATPAPSASVSARPRDPIVRPTHPAPTPSAPRSTSTREPAPVRSNVAPTAAPSPPPAVSTTPRSDLSPVQ